MTAYGRSAQTPLLHKSASPELSSGVDDRRGGVLLTIDFALMIVVYFTTFAIHSQ